MAAPKYPFNQDLIDDLAKRRVCLFVGSGVTASAKTRLGTSIKTWEGFLTFATGKVPNFVDKKLVKNLIKTKEYLLACEILKESLDQNVWEDLIREEFAQAGEPSALHKAIVSLDQRVAVTTNFDKFLETAWAEAKNITHHPKVLTRIDPEIFKVFREDSALIVKLHGSIDEPESMIFAKTDYAKKAFSNWVYSELVQILFLTHTFLFIGFSMSDPAISLIIENFSQKYPYSRPHYIFQPEGQSQKLKDLSRRLRKLFSIDYNASNNHAELLKMIEYLGKRVQARRKEFLAGQII